VNGKYDKMLGVLTSLDQEDLDNLSDIEKEFIMQGTGYALSISHSANAENGDMYIKPFAQKKYDWISAGSYCAQTHVEPVSDLFMAEQVDVAFANLQEKLKALHAEPIGPDKVNVIVIEANLGQSGNVPKKGWLTANLLALHQKYSEAKLVLYTFTPNFGGNYFDPEKKEFDNKLKECDPDTDLDLYRDMIVYAPKTNVTSKLVEVARTRLKPGMMSPTNSLSLGSPMAGSSPASSPFAFPERPKANGGAGYSVDTEAFKIMGRKPDHPESELPPAPSTPKHEAVAKHSTTSPLREGLGTAFTSLKVKTPPRTPLAIVGETSHNMQARLVLAQFSPGVEQRGVAPSPVE
jgi:hypothetical protein